MFKSWKIPPPMRQQRVRLVVDCGASINNGNVLFCWFERKKTSALGGGKSSSILQVLGLSLDPKNSTRYGCEKSSEGRRRERGGDS